MPLAANATVCTEQAHIYVYENTKIAASLDKGFSYGPRVFMKRPLQELYAVYRISQNLLIKTPKLFQA
jgi:hypothetical protein